VVASPFFKIVKSKETVLYENELQLYNATRFVFSSTSDFSMAKKIREKDETLRKPREQVTLREIEDHRRSIIQISNRMIKASQKESPDAGFDSFTLPPTRSALFLG